MSEQKCLGKKLRECREYLGYSQEQVARHLGLPSRPSVTYLESGRRKVSALELEKLARLYGKPVTYFLDPEPPIQSVSGIDLDGLDVQDRVELLRFADYLKWRKRMKEDA